MATINCAFHPQGLGVATNLRVILPLPIAPDDNYGTFYGSMKKFPVLWLLHGGSDNYASWHDCTAVEVLAYDYNIAVVMAQADNSSYTNMAYGANWLDYFTDELPRFIYSHFPISDKREDNFISGMSMGGYGAFKIGLYQPERFAAIAGIATAVGIPEKYIRSQKESSAALNSAFTAIFGHEDDPTAIRGTAEDCYFLLKNCLDTGKKLPKLMIAVGLEDFTHDDNVKYRQYAESLGVQIDWVTDHGIHDWHAWNLFIPKVFEWLPIKKD